ncbi:MAG: HEPN domain-containing protein [Deltaproteobacteria bacterium]|nr:HEPN domain-containing protein [Deltaproteobacteria bacterium]
MVIDRTKIDEKILEQDEYLHQVLFHCQQAVEKSLKAFLVWIPTPTI